MAEINLLPYKEKREVFKFNKRILRICALIFVSTFSLYLAIEAGSQYLSLSLKVKRMAIEKEKAEIAKYTEIEKDVKQLKEIVESLSQLEKNKTSWIALLSELASLTPSHLKITSLSLNSKGAPGLNISGEAASRKEIAIFRDKLETSQFFSETILGATSKAESPSGIYYTFSLTASLEKK